MGRVTAITVLCSVSPPLLRPSSPAHFLCTSLSHGHARSYQRRQNLPYVHPLFPPTSSLIVLDRPYHFSLPAVDEPHKIVKVIASDGKSGETKDISYTNCKVVGNGSFGVVFQAKLLDGGEGEDIAIKKVLQDKRFKVR